MNKEENLSDTRPSSQGKLKMRHDGLKHHLK